MQRRIKRWCNLALVVVTLNTAACGYLIYPERQGLRGDHVDGTIVALDAVGLLFFVLPGVVAFAVDFASGCIYLPEGKAGPFSMSLPNTEPSAPEGWVAVAQVAPFADDATIAAALRQHLHSDDRAANSARIEWLSTPGFAQVVRSN